MKRGLMILLVGVLFSLSLVSAATLSACGTVNSNTAYTLTGNVTGALNSNCFDTSSKSNITIDCQGYWIIGNTSSGFTAGIVGSSASSIKIYNCNFYNWSNVSSDAESVYFRGNNSEFKNITISSNSGDLSFYIGANNNSVDNLTCLGTANRVLIWGTAQNTTLTNGDCGITSSDSASSYGLNVTNWTTSRYTGAIQIYGGNHNLTNFEIKSNAYISISTITAGYIHNNIFINNLTIHNSSQSKYFEAYDLNNSYLINSNFYNNSGYFSLANATFGTKNFTMNNTVVNGSYLNLNTVSNSTITNNTFYYPGAASNIVDTFANLNYVNVSNNYFIGIGAVFSVSNYSRFFNNYGNNTADFYFKSINGTSEKVYSNTGINNTNQMASYNSYAPEYYNNTLVGKGASTHGIMLMALSHNNNVSQYPTVFGMVYNNSINNTDFALLGEWGSNGGQYYNNSICNASTAGYYDLHDSYNNSVYSNDFCGDSDIVVLDNITSGNYYNNTRVRTLKVYDDNAFPPYQASSNLLFDSMNVSSLWFSNFSSNYQNTNVIFRNITFGSESIFNGVYYKREWYFSPIINDTNGNLVNASNISVYNNSGSLVYTGLTDSFGAIPVQTLQEYFSNGTRYYSTNYTVNITKDGYFNYSQKVNLTSNFNSNFSLSENVSPNVTLVSPIDDYSETSSSASIDFKFNVSDDSDIANCSLYVNGANYSNSSSVNKSLTNKISVSGIAPGSYDWYVGCYDVVGNLGNSSNNSFVVDAPVVATSTGGGSVYYPTDNNINLGYSQKLFSGARVKFNLNGEIHQLRLNSVSSDYVNITVSSNPQAFSLRVGESKKLDLNEDSFYDLIVKLNSISSTVANVTVTRIREAIQNNTFAPVVPVNNSEEVNESEKAEISEVSERNHFWLGALLVGVIIVGLVVLAVRMHLRKKKHFYWKINLKKVEGF